MGSDYYNFQVFAGQENTTAVKKRLIAALGFRPECQVDLDLVRLKKTDDVEFSPNFPAAVSVGIPEYYRDYVDRLQTTNCDPKRQNVPLIWTGNFVDLGAFTEFEPDLPLHAA